MKFNKLNNKVYFLLIKTFLAFIIFNGCASQSIDLMPSHTSYHKTMIYKKYSCSQIQSKLFFLEKQAERFARMQNDNFMSDRKLISWGWILYGIPYLFLDGDGEMTKQFRNTLGKIDTLEKLAVNNDCKFNIKDSFDLNVKHSNKKYY